MGDAFNLLDWVIVGVVGLLVVAGLWKGLIRLVFAVLSVAAAVVLACLLTGVGTPILMPLTHNPAVAAVAAFILVFVVVLVLMGLLGRLLSKAVHLLGLGWVDRLGGAVVGLAVAVLLIGAVFLVVDLAGLDRTETVRKSTLAPYGIGVAGWLDGVFPKEVRHMIERRRKDIDEMEKRIEDGRRKIEDLPPEARERVSQEI